MAETLTYTQAVARNVATARGRCRGLTQKGLASRMQALGFDWRQQTVARVETAKRPAGADELLGLVLALETTVQELLSPSKSDWDNPVALPSGQTISPDYVESLVFGIDRGAVTWIDDKPHFGPDTQRTPVYSQRFVEVIRTASSSRPVEIEFRDARGSAVTFKMPGITPSDPSQWALTQPQQGDRQSFQSNTTES